MKALVGSWDHRPYQLLAEITALRSRVRDLEQALADAQRDNERLRAELGAASTSDAEHEVALAPDAEHEVALARG